MAVRDDFIPEEVPEGADALTSIRRHSRNSGAIEYLTRLLTTADAINLSPQTEPPRTYGTEFTADEAP